jgi:hypothetical protein
LRGHAPLMAQLHPKMIHELLAFIHNPEHEPRILTISGRYFACYAHVLDARRDFGHTPLVPGFPFAIHSNMNSEVLYDFAPFGAAVIAPTPLAHRGAPGLHQIVLPSFLEYALSQELWGPSGKWTRFHHEIQALLEKLNLIEEPSILGKYVLKAQAQRIEGRGILGDIVGNTYILTLPWTFSLTALNKLKTIIEEEF